jgi:phage shock protein A
MANQEIPDVRSRLMELRRLLAASMADEQRLYQRQIEEDREADRWQQRAKLAAGKGAGDLSGSALERAGRHAARAADLRIQYLQQKDYVEGMKARLLELETRARALPFTVVPPVDTSRLERTLSSLRRQEERAQEEQARLAAFAEMERDEVGEKLAALEREDHLERQLAELKSKLGVGGQGSAARKTG